MSLTLQTEKSSLYSYYRKAEEEFIQLIQNNDLDVAVKYNQNLMADFDDVVTFAIDEAYKNSNKCDRAHLFLQRVLYYIYRFPGLPVPHFRIMSPFLLLSPTSRP